MRVHDADVDHNGLSVRGNASDLGVTADGNVALGGGTYGALSVDTSAGSGEIVQSAPITVTGLATFSAGARDVILGEGNSLHTMAVDSGDDVTVKVAGGLILNNVTITGGLNVDAPGTVSLNGDLSGSGTLVKKGGGTMVINTAQAYAGDTQIVGGTLALSGAAAQAGVGGTVILGDAATLDLRSGATLSNALTSNGGTITTTVGTGALTGDITLAAQTRFDVPVGADGLTVAGNMGGTAGGVTKTGGGRLTFTGSNSYEGSTQIQVGELLVAGAGSLSPDSLIIISPDAVLALGQSQTAGSLSGNGQVDLGAFTLSIGGNGGTTTFGGGIVGDGGLTKLGGGTFTLTGENHFLGTTEVAQGTLVLANANGKALADQGAMTVAQDAHLTLAASETLGSLAGAGEVQLNEHRLTVGMNDDNTVFAGSIAGRGGLSKIGGGTLTLAGANTYAGSTLIDEGELRIENPAALAVTNAVSLKEDAILNLQTALSIGSLSGSGHVQLNSNTLGTGANNADTAFSGVIEGTGGVTKSGSGELTLSGVNVFSGPLNVKAGGVVVLANASGNALADNVAVTVDGTLRLANSEAIGSLAGAGRVGLGAQRLFAGGNDANTTFSGVITGSGGLSKQGDGVMRLTGNNEYAGATVIEGGTLQVGSGGSTGSLGSGAVDNRSHLVFERSDAVVVANAIGGSGDLTVGRGKVTLTNGANSYAGATVVAGGELATGGANRLPNGSAVQVAAEGKLTLAGDETVASITADGQVLVKGDVTTTGDQIYRGNLTIESPAGVHLTAVHLDAGNSANQLGDQPLDITADTAQLNSTGALTLGNVHLAQGGQVSSDKKLTLAGSLILDAGSLDLTAKATPDVDNATDPDQEPGQVWTVPVTGAALKVAEETITQLDGSSILLGSAAHLNVAATGGGSVNLAQDANRFSGELSVLSGPRFGTEWVANTAQSLVQVSGSQVIVGGAGIEADRVQIRADQLVTQGSSVLAARLPYVDASGTNGSAPGMLLWLSDAAFEQAFSFR